MLHLHRLEHDQVLPLAHLVALSDQYGDDRPLDRRGQPDRSVRAGEIRRLLSRRECGLRRLDRLIVSEQRQRIAVIDPRPREARRRIDRLADQIAAAMLVGGGQFRDPLVHPARVYAAAREIGMRQHALQERDVGLYALDPELA